MGRRSNEDSRPYPLLPFLWLHGRAFCGSTPELRSHAGIDLVWISSFLSRQAMDTGTLPEVPGEGALWLFERLWKYPTGMSNNPPFLEGFDYYNISYYLFVYMSLVVLWRTL